MVFKMASLEARRTSESAISIAVVFLLFLVAVVIRLFFLFEILDYHAYFPKYLELSRRLIGELSPPIEVFYSSPFYIFLLALLKSFLSLKVEQIKFLQVIVGSLNVVLIYFAGKEFFNAKTGLLAAGLSIIYAPLILHDCSLLTATYVISFNLSGLIAFSKFLKSGKLVFLTLAGIFFGLSLITRPTIAIFIIILAGSLFFPGKIGLRRSLRFCSPLFVVICLLLVAPVTGFNHSRSGEWVWITNSGGWVFYCSNNRNSTGLGFYPPPELMKIGTKKYLTERRGIGYTEHLDSIAIAEEKTGRLLSHKEVSHYWFAQAVKEIAENRQKYLHLLARKCFYALNQFEAHDTQEATLDSWRMASIPLLNFGLIIPLAFIGIIFSNRAKKGARWILLFYLAAYFLSLIIFYNIPRFRLPMEPILLVYASYAIYILSDIIRLRQVKTLLIFGVVLVVLSLGTHLSDKAIKVHREVAMPNAVRLAQGTRLLKAGQVSQAIPLFKKNIELNPQDKAAHYSLGLAYQRLGNEDLAQREFERAK